MRQDSQFTPFSAEKQAEYQNYAEDHWDKRLVRQSARRWNAMTVKEREALLAEGSLITTKIVAAIPCGSDSSEVQALVGKWHQHINRFYDCSYEILMDLGRAYIQHPDFVSFYRNIHPSMPEFLNEAIQYYCSGHGVVEN